MKIRHKYGGGYPANIEGLHQLHCLVSNILHSTRVVEQETWISANTGHQNLLRKALWYNFDYYHAQGLGPFSNDDNIIKFHVSK